MFLIKLFPIDIRTVNVHPRKHGMFCKFFLAFTCNDYLNQNSYLRFFYSNGPCFYEVVTPSAVSVTFVFADLERERFGPCTNSLSVSQPAGESTTSIGMSCFTGTGIIQEVKLLQVYN